MEQSRIITLEPSETGTDDIKAVSFEEAFGEFSELRGRGRNRRQKRKLDRIAKRRERKKARQQIRNDQQEARQSRKDIAKQRRVARKGMGEEPEEENENQPQNEGGEDQGSSSNQGGDQGGDQSYNEPQGSGDQGGDQGGSDENSAYQSSDEGSGEGLEDGSSDEESGFDGIHPEVKDVAKKIEWNKELVARLISRQKRLKLALQNKGEGRHGVNIRKELSEIESRINQRNKRIAQLEGQLNNFSNASGKNRSHVRKARVHAKKLRQKVGSKVPPNVKLVAKKMFSMFPPAIAMKKAQELIAKRKAKHGGSETPVESDMNPEFAKNFIEVPAQSRFEGGRGIIGMDQSSDYAPDDQPRVIELMSGADGTQTKSGSTLSKILAVGLAGVVIYAVVKSMQKK